MRIALTTSQWIVRITGVIQLALGALFWTGMALGLVPLHMLSGILLVLALWALAGVWGVVVVAFGLNQAQVLTGSLHWIVEVLHLPLGLGAIGQAENLAARGKASAHHAAAMAAG
ncbi:MAG: hypothetical protein ACRDGF_08830 [Chloroflexota bacterium]